MGTLSLVRDTHNLYSEQRGSPRLLGWLSRLYGPVQTGTSGTSCRTRVFSGGASTVNLSFAHSATGRHMHTPNPFIIIRYRGILKVFGILSERLNFFPSFWTHFLASIIVLVSGAHIRSAPRDPYSGLSTNSAFSPCRWISVRFERFPVNNLSPELHRIETQCPNRINLCRVSHQITYTLFDYIKPPTHQPLRITA